MRCVANGIFCQIFYTVLLNFCFLLRVRFVVHLFPFTVNCAQIAGLGLDGLRIRNAASADIRFRQIWIWDRVRCVQYVRAENANWI